MTWFKMPYGSMGVPLVGILQEGTTVHTSRLILDTYCPQTREMTTGQSWFQKEFVLLKFAVCSLFKELIRKKVRFTHFLSIAQKRVWKYKPKVNKTNC